jgi:hypothetical protein
MTVDVEALSPVEFLMLLNYEGNPPPDPAFDKIRMTPEEWRTMFPGAVQGAATPESEEPDASADHPPAAEAPQ